MGLSSELISQFTELANNKDKTKKETTVYGKIVDYGGKNYVQLDGSDLLTPIITTVEAKPGDRVTVLLKNHTATVTGNITSPAAQTETVKVIVKDIETVNEVLADVVTTNDLNAVNAKISSLEANDVTINNALIADQANITNLQSDNVEIKESLSANTASITELKAADIETNGTLAAQSASITDLQIKVEQVANESAKTATNYLNFSSTGLVVGDMTASTLGNNVLIDSDSVDIRNGTTTLASFGASKVTLNKPLVLNGIMHTGKNKVLWSGGYYMSDAQTATLSEAISDQPNGIVLLWSYYVDGASDNSNFRPYFIPKQFVASHPGNGISMFMTNGTMDIAASKYVYVSDTSIKGHANNDDDATTKTCGITSTPKNFVLRYVIGV